MYDPLHNPLLNPRHRFRLGRVAKGWIVEDRLLGKKLIFRRYKSDAIWALIQIRKTAKTLIRASEDDRSVGQTG